MAVRDEQVLSVATEVLVADPAASLGSVAAAAGMGRTTLHQRFPTREALVQAVAQDALARLDAAVDAALHGDGDLLQQLLDALIPLGPQIAFLLRHPAVSEAELQERVAAQNVRIEARIVAAQEAGVLSRSVPAWWIRSTVDALAYAAWEAVAEGRLARLDAADLARRTLGSGVES